MPIRASPSDIPHSDPFAGRRSTGDPAAARPSSFPAITSLEEFLLLLDAVVPPNQSGTSAALSVDSADTLAADAACAFPGGEEPAGWG